MTDSKPLSAKEMLEQARREIEELSADRAIELHVKDDVVIVDIRDSAEVAELGGIPGAFHAPRGSLEFWIDPDSPAHKEVFSSGKHIVFHCASGGRSALAAQTAQRMGLQRVSHVKGGFAAWKEAGGPVTGKRGEE